MPRKAPPLRLASVAGDNAFGDVDVGANVGKGQNFGLTTPKPRIVFDETKLADAAFSFILEHFQKVPAIPAANESNTNAIK